LAPGLCETILLQSIKYLSKISYLERFRYRLSGSQLATTCCLTVEDLVGEKRANTDDDGVNDNRRISSYCF